MNDFARTQQSSFDVWVTTNDLYRFFDNQRRDSTKMAEAEQASTRRVMRIPNKVMYIEHKRIKSLVVPIHIYRERPKITLATKIIKAFILHIIFISFHFFFPAPHSSEGGRKWIRENIRWRVSGRIILYADKQVGRNLHVTEKECLILSSLMPDGGGDIFQFSLVALCVARFLRSIFLFQRGGIGSWAWWYSVVW